jgi:NADPH:quinone reductase-like Zn-dependent oxidoreductase
MKAIICNHYGGPETLRLQEVSKPTPLEDEVLIRIRATSINARDWRMMHAIPFFIRLMPGGFWRPKNRILGADLAGQVEAIGRNVKHFKPGDEVFGYLPGKTGCGTFTEYVCAPQNLIALKPANLTFEQSAAVPLAAVTALQGLRDAGNIQPGQKVLIQGASGGVGTFAVQLGKAFGAEVTAVCSTRNLEMARSLGAARVIDYTKVDFMEYSQQYDLILVVNGYHPISDYLRVLKLGGSCVVAGGSMRQLMQASMASRKKTQPGSPRVVTLILKQDPGDLELIQSLLETGKIVPVIDFAYPLEKTPEAFRQYEREHSRGKFVIHVA